MTQCALPIAKVRNFYEILMVKCGEPDGILPEVTTFDSVKPRRAKGFIARLWLKSVKV